MKNHQSLWLRIKMILIVILLVGIIAIILLNTVNKFSAYNINTPELTAICGFLGVVVAVILNRLRRYKMVSKYESKELDNINKDVNDILEHIDKDAKKDMHHH